MGHLGEAATRATAKNLGWVLKGPVIPCAACAAGKAKQKSVPQVSEADPLEKGKNRAYVDICPIKPKPGEKKITKPNWRMIVLNDDIQYKVSDFYQKRSDMVEPSCVKLREWRNKGKHVTNLRMDNAGENKSLKDRVNSADWKLDVEEVEFTSRDSPQQNHLVEIGFTTIADRGRAMMNGAHVPTAKRRIISKEAFKMATALDNLVVVDHGGEKKSRYEHVDGKLPGWTKHMRVFGEAGVVKTKTKTTPKSYDKGVLCVFVGYADEHPSDCYRMWNPETNGIHVTRDVTWLKRMYYKVPSNKGNIVKEQGPVSRAKVCCCSTLSSFLNWSSMVNLWAPWNWIDKAKKICPATRDSVRPFGAHFKILVLPFRQKILPVITLKEDDDDKIVS